MEFDELLRGFGERVGIADLPLKDGVCQIDVDGMSVNFVEVPQTRQVVTWAEVGEVPPEGRERLYRALMEAMFMGRATGGSTFSVNPETGRLILFRLDPLQLLDAASFLSALERFVDVLEGWRKLLGEFSAASQEIAKTEAASAEESRQLGLGGFLKV